MATGKNTLVREVNAFRGGILGYTVFKRTYAAPVTISGTNSTSTTSTTSTTNRTTTDESEVLVFEDEKKEERDTTAGSNKEVAEEAQQQQRQQTENFEQCIDRMLQSGLIQQHCRFSKQDESSLRRLMLDQKCSLSGRCLQSLGVCTEEEKDDNSNNNFLPLSSCAFTKVSHPVEPFVYTMRMSLYGVGVGYSVERKYVDQLPKLVEKLQVKKLPIDDDAESDVVCIASSRESWIQLLAAILSAYFGGNSSATTASTTRESGVFTYRFESESSGDTSTTTTTTAKENNNDDIKALDEAIQNLVSVLNARVGQHARPIDCMDVMNIVAPVVVVGRTRRAALLALGDANDVDFLRSKRWDLGNLPLWRCASNNSVVCNDVSKLPVEFWDTYRGKGEAMGLVNIDLFQQCGRVGERQYTDPNVWGVSACAEQGLASGEVSCLAELMLPHFRSKDELWEATRLVYTVCKHKYSLGAPHHFISTQETADKHTRMGLGVTGYMQASDEQKSWLSDNYDRLRAYDTSYSLHRGLSPSIKLTTIKPSGTVSLLSGNTPGCHPGFAPYFIRRVRFNADSPLLQPCLDMGLHTEPERGWGDAPATGRQVVEFPCQLPPGTQLANETTAIQQLEVVRRLQREWSDSAVSVTIYYRLNELEDIQRWLSTHYQDTIKACSFMLHCDHGFDQAPYEEIDQMKFEELVQSMSSC